MYNRLRKLQFYDRIYDTSLEKWWSNPLQLSSPVQNVAGTLNSNFGTVIIPRVLPIIEPTSRTPPLVTTLPFLVSTSYREFLLLYV